MPLWWRMRTPSSPSTYAPKARQLPSLLGGEGRAGCGEGGWGDEVASPPSAPPKSVGRSTGQRGEVHGGAAWLRREPETRAHAGPGRSGRQDPARYFFTSSASSPVCAISVTMSQPPTNLPSMYTWGIVGQLEYSLIAWRISASSSTLREA